MEFRPFFEQYEQLVRQVDAAFEKVKTEYAGAVLCKPGCADCCYALFDLTLVEALYIKSRFDQMFSGQEAGELIGRANDADRKIYRLKREAYKAHETGKPEQAILEEMALHRVRCPCLDADDRCVIYEVRPITCRVYGIPTVVGGRAHTCGVSGFEEGQAYPTVKLDAIYQRLYDISFALAQNIQSRYPKLAEMLVPLSMALLTDYNEAYLGIRSKEEATEKE
jgi:Fe-S-cluster containining protein